VPASTSGPDAFPTVTGVFGAPGLGTTTLTLVAVGIADGAGATLSDALAGTSTAGAEDGAEDGIGSDADADIAGDCTGDAARLTGTLASTPSA